MRLFKSSNRAFVSHVINDQMSFLVNGVQPVYGQTKERARSAVDWILRAQDATVDDGVSYGYFPCDVGDRWRASYPETTGYIVPSLLRFSKQYGDDEIRQRALRMAKWETEIQMPSGAVQGGTLCLPEKQTPATFNTGMVLDGWSAAFRENGDATYLEAGRRAADFLVGDISKEGYFKTNGQFVTSGAIKTYNCLCAWALYRFGEDAENDLYKHSAIRVIEAALGQQQENGWIANNCLGDPKTPLLHTIGYTLQGILEVGILSENKRFVEAVQLGIAPVLLHLTAKGFIPGRFYTDWEPAALSSCLTGSAQIAVILYRLYEYTDNRKYREAADRIVNYLKGLQMLHSKDEGINGALAGSFPLFGGYITAGYPNWATKYFLDSLMAQDLLGDA